MNSKYISLINRQRSLKVKIAQERIVLNEHLEPLRESLSWVDRIFDSMRFIKRNPVLLVTAFSVLAAYKPAMARRLITVSFTTLNFVKQFKNIL